MVIKVRTKRRLITTTAVLAGLLVGGFVFVSYYMHAVYEAEDILDPEAVPAPVREHFAQRFPGASDAEWKFADDLYEALFPWEEQDEFEAYFHPDGTLAKTEYPITFPELPEKARAYLESEPAYKAKDVERVDMPGSPVAYEVEFGNLLMAWDCLFDAEGNLLSRSRDDSPLEESASGDE